MKIIGGSWYMYDIKNNIFSTAAFSNLYTPYIKERDDEEQAVRLIITL